MKCQVSTTLNGFVRLSFPALDFKLTHFSQNHFSLFQIAGCGGHSKMSTEQFCLRWNDFHTNITSAFSDIRDDDDFLDVTLVSIFQLPYNRETGNFMNRQSCPYHRYWKNKASLKFKNDQLLRS